MEGISQGRQKLLIITLWLIAIHSFVVGFFLIFLPAYFLPVFGFEPVQNNFFRAQGGIFHFVFTIVYIIAATNLQNSRQLIIISVIAKMIATVFLLTYYFFINNIWTVLFSGIVDFILGAFLFYIYFVRGFEKKGIE